MLKKLYHWTMQQAEKPYAEKMLAIVSFAESSFFPIPPDVMLAPMVLAKPQNAYRTAFICTLASVLGALLGYAIGALAAPLGTAILEFFGYDKGLEAYKAFVAQWGMWAILIKGLTPIPFKLVTIASGLGQMNLLVFTLSCALTRGVRFFGVAYLCKKFGPEITAIIEKRIYLVAGVAIALLVGGFLLAKLMH